MSRADDEFKDKVQQAHTVLQMALYFLRTILEDRKKGLYLVFFEEEMWRAAEKSPMAAFLRKYQGGTRSPGPPPGRETWSDLVIKRIGEEFVPLWRTREPHEESYAAVQRAAQVIRDLLKQLRDPDKADARTRAAVIRLADRDSAREALREIVTSE